MFRSGRKLMQWHPRIPEGAGFQVDTLCVTGDTPLMITSWRCCSGKPAHQSVCLRCWQSWKPPVVLRPEDVQTSPWWNHPLLPSKGPCWWKGIPRPGGKTMRHEAVRPASHHWLQHVCGRQILPQGTEEASAFCLQAFCGAAGLSQHLSTAGKCWRASNPKGDSATGGQKPVKRQVSQLLIFQRDSSEVCSKWFPRLTLAGLNPSFPQWFPAHSVIQSFKKIVANYTHIHTHTHTHTYGLPKWRNATECLPMLEALVEKIPWRKKWQFAPVFLPGKFLRQMSLTGYSPWGPKESDMTEHACKHTHVYGQKMMIKMVYFLYILYFGINI